MTKPKYYDNLDPHIHPENVGKRYNITRMVVQYSLDRRRHSRPTMSKLQLWKHRERIENYNSQHLYE